MSRRTQATMVGDLAVIVLVCGILAVQGEKMEMTLVPTFHPMFVMLNTPFELTCRVKGVPQAQDVEMLVNYLPPDQNQFKVSKQVNVENDVATTTVKITKDAMEQTDSGTYFCQSGGTEKQFTVVVFAVSIQSSNVTVGDDVTIKCEPGTTFQQLTLVWKKKGKPLADIPGVRERVKLSDKNFTLTMEKAVEDDAGEYECNIIFFQGTTGEQNFSQTASMFGKPYFRTEEGDKNLSIAGNKSIDLSCDSLGYPKPDVAWLKDDDVINAEPGARISIKTNKTSSRLTVTQLRQEDEGKYVCNVENSLGRKQRSFQVAIEGVINSAAFFSLGLSHLLLLFVIFSLTL